MGRVLVISVLAILVCAILGLILLVEIHNSVPGRSFVNYPFDRETPSGALIQKWFHKLNREAVRQGIMCYVDPKAVTKKYPGLHLRESTQYNLDWVDGKGYVVKIIKNLTDAKGQTPVVNQVPLPSSTTCTYWVQSGEESCSCKYPGSNQPGEDFYEKLGLSYPVYKRKPHRPASELTVHMFGPNENPESKLRLLSKGELIILHRNMYPKEIDIEFPIDMKQRHPELGLWTLPEFTTSGNENDGYRFAIQLRTYQSNGKYDVEGILFNTKTRELSSYLSNMDYLRANGGVKISDYYSSVETEVGEECVFFEFY